MLGSWRAVCRESGTYGSGRGSWCAIGAWLPTSPVIKPFATQNALKMLTPAGTDSNQPIEKTDADKTILSDIDKSLLYYTAIDPTHANVFARVWQKITVNGQSSITQMPLDISLRYEEEKKRWMVDEMTIQQPLKENGYIN